MNSCRISDDEPKVFPISIMAEHVRESWEEIADEPWAPPSLPVNSPRSVGTSIIRIEKKAHKKVDDKAMQTNPHSATNSPSALESSSSSSPELGKVRILKRDPAQIKHQTSTQPLRPSPVPKSFQERLEAYNAARMRIFGCLDHQDANNALDSDDSSEVPPASNPVSSPSSNSLSESIRIGSASHTVYP